MLAISGGELSLELNFYKIDKCLQINKEKGYLGGNFTEPLLQLPKGGLSWFGDKSKPVFICEDDCILKKTAPSQGVGFRTEAERRMYLPEWLQHEFFHHLFTSWPDLNLEKDGNHQWFDRSKWPADFTGKIEEDYYSEALNKRLYQLIPSIAQRLQRADK